MSYGELRRLVVPDDFLAFWEKTTENLDDFVDSSKKIGKKKDEF